MMLKPEPPTIEETLEGLDSLQLWDGGSSPSPIPGGSDMLSVLSDGSSRRHSILFDEDEGGGRGTGGGGGGDAGTELGSEDASTEPDEYLDEEARKRKHRDEVFVDKTRAAMVVIGTKDIKEALERKKADEIMRRNPEARVAHVLFSQARFLAHQGRFAEALAILDRALAVDAERKDWLTEKSRCYLHLLQPEMALQTVDQVLKKDPAYFKAIVLKGEILYSLWDLERAMLCFVEGRRMRPDDTHCIRGVHKVRMALHEIAAYQVPSRLRKAKKRSKSARARLTRSKSPVEELLQRDSRPPSSTRLSEDPTSTPSSTPIEPRLQSPSISPSAKISNTGQRRRGGLDDEVMDFAASEVRPLSARGKRKPPSGRPKTAVAVGGRRRSAAKSGDPEIDDIRRFVRESMSGSYRSTSRRRFSGSTQPSARSGFSSQSVSSSMEDVSRDSYSGGFRLPRMKETPRPREKKEHKKRVTLGTNVTASLGQDRMFLDSLLKDKDLRRSKTAHSKRALKIARDVQGFVSERQRYWRNREDYIRYANTDEDTLL